MFYLEVGHSCEISIFKTAYSILKGFWQLKD